MSLAAAFSFQTQFLALIGSEFLVDLCAGLHSQKSFILSMVWSICITIVERRIFYWKMGVMHCSGEARERRETQEVPCQSKMDRKSNILPKRWRKRCWAEVGNEKVNNRSID